MSNFKPGDRVAATTTIRGQDASISPGDLGTVRYAGHVPTMDGAGRTVYEVNFDDAAEPYSGAGVWVVWADELEAAP